MSALLLKGGVRQENLSVRGTVWSRSGLRERREGKPRTYSAAAHASEWGEDDSCSEEDALGLELAGSHGAWDSSGRLGRVRMGGST